MVLNPRYKSQDILKGQPSAQCRRKSFGRWLVELLGSSGSLHSFMEIELNDIDHDLSLCHQIWWIYDTRYMTLSSFLISWYDPVLADATTSGRQGRHHGPWRRNFLPWVQPVEVQYGNRPRNITLSFEVKANYKITFQASKNTCRFEISR